MRLTKSKLRVVRCAEQVAIAERLIAESGVGLLFVTRRELAALLKVSVRTVDEMAAAKEITPFRLRGVLVRFFVPEVIAELKAAALLAESHRGTTGLLSEQGNPRAEIRNPNCGEGRKQERED